MIDFKKLLPAIAFIVLAELAPTVPVNSQGNLESQVASLRAQIQDMKDDLAAMRGEIQAARSVADQASRLAQSRSSSGGDQNTAIQALSTAQSNSTAIEALNEKVDRLFKRSSK